MRSKVIKRKRNVEPGFTIIELLVSVGVMVIITSVLVARYSSFNSAVLLKSQAYEVGLAIREAQLYSVASQGGEEERFRSVYGVYFDLDSPNTYILYRDEDDNGRFSPGTDVELQTYQLDDRFEIRGFVDSDNGGSAVGGNELSISFLRPNFDARFHTGSGSLNVNVVYIEVVTAGATGNDNNELRTIEVSTAGQITVQ